MNSIAKPVIDSDIVYANKQCQCGTSVELGQVNWVTFFFSFLGLTHYKKHIQIRLRLDLGVTCYY